MKRFKNSGKNYSQKQLYNRTDCHSVFEGRCHEGLSRGVDHRRRDFSTFGFSRNLDGQVRDQKNGLCRWTHRDDRNALVIIFCWQGEWVSIFMSIFSSEMKVGDTINRIIAWTTDYKTNEFIIKNMNSRWPLFL